MRKKVRIESGKLTYGRNEVADMIAKAKDNYYAFEIKRWDRTIEQNALYWKWLTDIGNDLGYTKEELHEIFIDLFAPIFTTKDLQGKPKQNRLRTSKMNVTQMSEYMNHIDRWAAENGIVLPQPE